MVMKTESDYTPTIKRMPSLKSSIDAEGGSDGWGLDEETLPDEEDKPEQEDPFSEVNKFLSQIPPDWDAAEAHANANRVVDRSTIKLDVNNEESFCKCCQMTFPTEDNLYSICADNIELGELGPGFPLFFEFVKYLCYLMFVLTIVYFLPCAYLIYEAWKNIEN